MYLLLFLFWTTSLFGICQIVHDPISVSIFTDSQSVRANGLSHYQIIKCTRAVSQTFWPFFAPFLKVHTSANYAWGNFMAVFPCQISQEKMRPVSAYYFCVQNFSAQVSIIVTREEKTVLWAHTESEVLLRRKCMPRCKLHTERSLSVWRFELRTLLTLRSTLRDKPVYNCGQPGGLFTTSLAWVSGGHHSNTTTFWIWVGVFIIPFGPPFFLCDNHYFHFSSHLGSPTYFHLLYGDQLIYNILATLRLAIHSSTYWICSPGPRKSD